MAKNVIADKDSNNNIKPNKKKSRESIDGISGLIMAIRFGMTGEAAEKSIYETRGVLAV